jgi:signal transduction histidine kinase
MAMSLLEIIQVVGYSTGAALHLWIGKLLLTKRRRTVERILLCLTVAIGLWHASNLFLTFYGSLGLARWHASLRMAETIAVITITLAYSLLLHIHLHLWANARQRPLTRFERVRVYLSYIPLLFLTLAIPPIWTEPYAPMLERLSHLVLPFALWAAYVLALVAVTDLLIARNVAEANEKSLMRTLAGSFILVAILMLAAYAFNLGGGTIWAGYLRIAANLGSLLPTSLLAYHIYRYRYLELIIERSLFVAVFAIIVLIGYLYGVRLFGDWLTSRYGLREGVIEPLLIIALVLTAVPLHYRLRRWVHELFVRETEIYRNLLGEAGTQRWSWERLPQFLDLAARKMEEALRLERVQFIIPRVSDHELGRDWEERLLQRIEAQEMIENDSLLAEHGWTLARALRWEGELLGVMLVKASEFTSDVYAALEVVARQIAIVVRDCRLVEENLKLERELAEGERLAALGQMAATIAHEIKNPLSAIKSIVQVMREDERLQVDYKRDLDMIIGETDRLSHSLAQLLGFARQPSAEESSRSDVLVRNLIALFRAEAQRRGVNLELRADAACELNAQRTIALRDSLSNLISNALQATPAGMSVRVELFVEDETLCCRVSDEGQGVPAHLRERIWEPFFTTRQRGTGLGLAIVRKRMEEIGGAARYLAERERGACFELRLPLRDRTSVRSL